MYEFFGLTLKNKKMRNYLSNNKRLIFIIFSQIVLIIALWRTNRFLMEFKSEEQNKMEILGSAYQKLNNAGLNEDISLPQNIFNSNKTIPIIIINQDSIITSFKNLKWDKKKKLDKKDSTQILKLAKEYAKTIEPVHFSLKNGKYQNLYYGRSSLYTKLLYYPMILVGIFLLFVGLIYQYYRTGKISDENKLWNSLAKETAHQIGTPLSSLMGWIEIMKMPGDNQIPVEELEKDVQRLNIISQRFSKIGSQPELKLENLVEINKNAINYLRSRASKLVEINCQANKDKVYANINKQLYEWVLENLVKNAIDAMEGKGKIDISLTENKHQIVIDVSDTGKGIASGMIKDIFRPGFTTKKRGWGLGLSLSKRIIEEYHKGKMFVLKSIPNEGTTFRIILRKN